jgi:hypothetical protein
MYPKVPELIVKVFKLLKGNCTLSIKNSHAAGEAEISSKNTNNFSEGVDFKIGGAVWVNRL